MRRLCQALDRRCIGWIGFFTTACRSPVLVLNPAQNSRSLALSRSGVRIVVLDEASFEDDEDEE